MSFSATILCLLGFAPAAPERLPYLAVMNLKAPGIEAGTVEAINSHLASELVRSGAFRVMERTQMDKILAEQGFQKSGACDKSECDVELGKLLSVDRIVVGDLGRVGTQFALSARMIDVQTGEILLSVTESGAGNLEETSTDLVPLIADRLANSGEFRKRWSLSLSARGGATIPFLGEELASSAAWDKEASANTSLGGAVRISRWWTRSLWTSVESGVQSNDFSAQCIWDSSADAFHEMRSWKSNLSLQTVQASLLIGFTGTSGFTLAIGGTWNYPLEGEIEQTIQRRLRTPDGKESNFELPSRQLDPTSATSGGKATSNKFAFEPFWDAVAEIGWTFKPGWHLLVRSELSLTSFYLPVQTTTGGESMFDPLEFSSYSTPMRYGDADLAQGIRLLRVQASIGKSFPF
ncbi:MAG: hypothetical protein IPN71_14430 [Fibrobacteres bacterium]|nr:hypothetical protein [Fibrobacterota bacterium]